MGRRAKHIIATIGNNKYDVRLRWRFINYNKYAWWMSVLAHEYNRSGIEGLERKYREHRHHGIYKKYFRGYIKYLKEIESNGEASIANHGYSGKLVLGIVGYDNYIIYGDKQAFLDNLKNAKSAFLSEGLLISEVQEAVK